MKSLTAIITLFATCTAFQGAATEPETEYYDLVETADKAAADGKWQNAIDAIDKAMRIEPTNPSNVLLLSNKGMFEYYSGQDSLALETLSIAQRIAPASVTVLQNRAKVLTDTGRLKEALRDYAAVMALDSTLVEPLFYHTMISFQLNDAETAQADLDRMKRLFPDHQSTLLAESSVLAYSGRFLEAIPLLSRLIEKKPTAADYSTRALCYLRTDQLPEAAEDIAQGLKLDPTDGELYLLRALLNKMRFRPDDAHADALKAERYGVDSSRIKALNL